MDNQNYNNQVNPFQMQNPQLTNKKTKAFVIAIIVAAVVFLACIGAIIWCVSSGNGDDESERERKPYSGGSYAVKSKMAAANSTAYSVSDAINTVLCELDEKGLDTGLIEYMSYSKGDDFIDISGDLRGADGEEVYRGVKEYFSDVDKVDFVAKINRGVCIAVISTSDEKYWGTRPLSLTYEDYKKAEHVFTLEEVMEKVKDRCGDDYGFEDFHK